MNNKEFKAAFDFIVKEKNIDPEVVKEAMQNALAAGYKKNTGEDADVRAEFNTENGMIRLFRRMTVVDEIENEDTELSLEEAQEINPNYKVGDVIENEVDFEDFGRVAVSVAKQD